MKEFINQNYQSEKEELANVNYRNITYIVKNHAKPFVETDLLKEVTTSTVNGLLRTRVNNLFISTDSSVFKEQMAEYIAKNMLTKKDLQEYVVIEVQNNLEDYLLDMDFRKMFEDLIYNNLTKIVLFINDFDVRIDAADYLSFFYLIKDIKETLGFEEIKLISTVAVKEFGYNDLFYSDPELKFDIIILTEPNVEKFSKVLKIKINHLSEEHKVKISKEILEYFDLMYMVQELDNYSMGIYLDLLDFVFAIAESNNRKNVKKSDINKSFCTFFTQSWNTDKTLLKETCYHEAGHYVIADAIFGNEYKLKVLTCISDCNGSLGTIIGDIEKMEYSLDKNLLYQYVAYCLGGALAEEIIGVSKNLGSEEDLEELMDFVKDWLLKSGANSEMGEYCYYKRNEISNKKLEVLEKEAASIILAASKYGRRILKERKKFLDMLADELYKKKLLCKKDIVKIYKKSLLK